MWRLIPLLAVLGFLEVLVPWPEVAGLVLSNPRPPVVRLAVHPPMAPSERRHDREQLLVQLPEKVRE